MIGKYRLEHPADCQTTQMKSHTYTEKQDDLLSNLDSVFQCREGKSEHWTLGRLDKHLPHYWAGVTSFVWAWVTATGRRNPIILMDVTRILLTSAECWQMVLFTGSRWAGSRLVGWGSTIPTIRAATGKEPKWLHHIGLSLSHNALRVLLYKAVYEIPLEHTNDYEWLGKKEELISSATAGSFDDCENLAWTMWCREISGIFTFLSLQQFPVTPSHQRSLNLWLH